MFVRKKKNKSGVISIQIIDKSTGRYKVIKTYGSTSDPHQAESLFLEAKAKLHSLFGQEQFNFSNPDIEEQFTKFLDSINALRLVGPEIVLGKIFKQIGYEKIEGALFKHLVITRLVYPVSKLKTADYLFRYKGVIYSVDKIYRYLDQLNQNSLASIEEISYQYATNLYPGASSVVFYDVTTLYFETEDEDDLRRTGFSKEGKHHNPQILLALLVNGAGYPLGYEIFEGNKFEGHTMLPVIEAFKRRYRLQDIVVVADSGLLSEKNISELIQKGYQYILGARIKNMPDIQKKRILKVKLQDGQSKEVESSSERRLIISYSSQRAKKDAFNRRRGIKKLEKSIISGRLTKRQIVNRGYNKFLKLTGSATVEIDYQKLEADAAWDGLKGYITNTGLSKEEIIGQYKQLWQIERSFRISKSDLRIRPIYHRLQKRIRTHISIAFAACVVYKELERQLKERGSELSPEKVIDILKTIYEITISIPGTNKMLKKLILKTEEQTDLLAMFDLEPKNEV